NTLRVGPPGFLGKSWSYSTWLRVTRTSDGKHAAYVNEAQEIRVLDLDNQTFKVIGASRNAVKRVTISPDGKWVAAGRWNAVGFDIWDAHSGRLVKQLQPADGHANVTFSPDSKWLITGARNQYRCWEAGSWKLRFQIPFKNGTLHPVAFTNDAKMVAVAWSDSVVKLIETSTGRELAKLEPAHHQPITWMCFTPDATKLAVACSTHKIQLWDLRLIRKQLDAMGLDWDTPSYEPVEPQLATDPVHLEVLPGKRGGAKRDWNRELMTYNQLIDDQPNDPNLFLARANVHEYFIDTHRAIKDYSRAIELQTKMPDSYYNRARMYQRQAQDAQALSDYRHVLQLDPDHVAALGELARLHVLGPAELRDPPQALKLLERAIQIAPRDHPALTTLGITYYRLEQYQKAVDAFERSFQNKSVLFSEDIFFLAMCQARLGNMQQARGYYGRAMRRVRDLFYPRATAWKVKKCRDEAEQVLGLVATDPTEPAAQGDDKVTSIFVEGVTFLPTAQSTEGEIYYQPMRRFGTSWSGDAQLYWVPRRSSARLTLKVHVPAAGTYTIAAAMTNARNYGRFQCTLNGQKLGEALNAYGRATVHTDEVVLGTARLEPGDHEIVFEVVGKDTRSTGFRLGIDYLRLTGQPEKTAVP
ncbi:MAG: hypothetical protein O7F71_00625, partial [Gammaproteobacteria bacterium]|nr:hypothetical protein [Gammaproteobacteria bacterium]